MSIAIAPYTPEWQPAVRAFNTRLGAAGVRFQFPDCGVCTPAADAPIVKRGFVAVQDGQSVRGGYLVKEQLFALDGRMVRLGYLHLPLSEGLIDRRFSTLGVQLIAHALRRQPLLFGLGIGGRTESFAQVVTALGWSLQPVPFLFKVVRPARVARRLTAIRRTPLGRVLCEMAAWSGLAAAGTWALQARLTTVRNRGRKLEAIDRFDTDADDLWQRNRHQHRLVAVRDDAALHQLYDEGSRPFLRWVLRSTAGITGWAVALDTAMTQHKFFGDLRVATIVDGFADPDETPALVAGVTRALASRGVDLIVSNQSSGIWIDALRRSGFVTGPSNFFFAASPALGRALGTQSGSIDALHLTRGDGDGPINL